MNYFRYITDKNVNQRLIYYQQLKIKITDYVCMITFFFFLFYLLI